MQNSRFLQQFIFWSIWLIIPLIWELLGDIAGAFISAFKKFRTKEVEIDYFPQVSILIPVFNSGKTLNMCLESIYNQSYPMENIEILLIDNGSNDESYEIFKRFQAEHSDLKIWWYVSQQGKSKALNKGIFGSTGKYVINIDSDGSLDRFAIENVVKKFENDSKISCMTGVILTDPELISSTKNKFHKALKICELFEYAESFFVGRILQSSFNTMYTMAGAFSCFKREVLMKTQMYNSETVGEDTHMTYQIKDFIGGKVILCEDAFFYTDPIESFDKLYTQRQRWQRAELEVASLFTDKHIGGLKKFITNSEMRKMVSDHTLVFPRLIWFFAMIYLYFIDYPLSLLIGSNLLLYSAYAINSFLYLLVESMYLKSQSNTRSFLLRRWYICFIMPFYRFLIYWIRVAGIINSIKTDSTWHVSTFSEEINILKTGVEKTAQSRFPFLDKLRNLLNKD